MANGWQELGLRLAGGGGNPEAAYADQVKRNASASEALARAHERRKMALARDGITADAFIAAGADPGAAGLAASVVGAGATPNVRNAGLTDFAELGLQREAMEAARSGNTDLMNMVNAVRGKKLMERTKITQGQAFDPYAAPDQSVQLTPLGEATAAAKGAQGRQYDARAGVYDAQAAAGGWKPSTGGRGGKTLSVPEAEAKINWIMAQANKKSADGEPEEFVDAWVQNEMVKAGIQPEPAADFSGVVSAVTPPVGVRPLGDAGVAPTIESLPEQAVARLKEGIVTNFGNGQAWTLVNGKPSRIR